MERPEIIAHRGGLWPTAAENSLESFQLCAQLGLRWIETDVHASSDGVLYAVHDDSLERLAGRPGAIRSLPAVELDSVELIGGGALPRLSSVLDALPEMCFNIDIKADSGVGPIVRLLRGSADAGRIRLASFSSRRLAGLRMALPGIRTSAGTAEVGRFLLTGNRAHAGIHSSVDALQVPVRWGPVPVVTRRLLRISEQAGLEVHVWTVNDPSHMSRLAQAGVDGLVTDHPRLCMEVLDGAAGERE